MNFADRLHTALFENVLVEYAWFSLPKAIPMPDRQGNIVHVKYLDMRWEDYKNPYIRKWGQWTPFIATLPVGEGYTRQYLIWDGVDAKIVSPSEVDPEITQNYYPVPKKWWQMAQGMDAKGDEVLKPKVRRKVAMA